MNKVELRSKLVKLDILIDNEYLDKYVDLVYSCLTNTWIKYKCQRHHIVPRCYYKFNNLPVNNDSENIVIMLHYQHLLAHYYLTLCSKEDYFRDANALAFRNAVNHSWYKSNCDYVEERILIENLPEYQQLVELANKAVSKRLKGTTHITAESTKLKISKTLQGHVVSKETREKISKSCKGNTASNKGKICYTNGLTNIFLDSNENVPEGFIRGGRRTGTPSKNKGKLLSEDIKQKISNKLLGYKAMTNGVETKHIYPDEIDLYLSNGWVFGTVKTFHR